MICKPRKGVPLLNSCRFWRSKLHWLTYVPSALQLELGEFIFHNALILAIKMNVSLNSIERMTFLMTTHCVYCELQMNLCILFRRNLCSRTWTDTNRKDPPLSTTHKRRGGTVDGFHEAPLLVWPTSSILMSFPLVSLSGSLVFRSYLYAYNIAFHLMYVWPCIMYQLTRCTNLMQLFWFIINNSLYMFRAFIWPSSGVQVFFRLYFAACGVQH